MSSVSLTSTTPFFLEMIDQGNLENDIIINQFVPKINKALVKSIKKSSPLMDIYSGIDYCNFIKHQFKKIPKIEDHFNYINDLFFKPQIRLPDNRCLDFEHPEVINLMLRNLSKYQQIEPMKIISPKQDKNNCWFNTAFMVFFISDQGKKFSKYFRQYCITGGLNNIRQTNQNLRISLFYLNIYIDSCIQGSVYSLYLNSNFIINRIYQTIPYDPFIQDGNTRGCPIRYYYSLISKLNLHTTEGYTPLYEISLGKNNLHSMGDLKRAIELYSLFSPTNNLQLKAENSFYAFPQKIRQFPEILLVYIDIVKYPNLNISDKVKYLKIQQATYCLDSVIIVHLNQHHVCCLVTINKNYFLYDGASFKKLIPFKWMKYLNSYENINFECYTSGVKSMGVINLRRSPQQILIYYRIK